MPEISVNIDIYCGKCGAGLCGQTSDTSTGHRLSFTVDPCERCQETAKDDGYNKGCDETNEKRDEEDRNKEDSE